jgi:hypothetical protein
MLGSLLIVNRFKTESSSSVIINIHTLRVFKAGRIHFIAESVLQDGRQAWQTPH